MNEKTMKLKDIKLFDVPFVLADGNTVKPENDFIEFKKEEIYQSVASRFEQQVRIYEDKTAVKCDDRFLTYDALNREANRVAHTVLETYDDRYRLNENEKTRYTRQMMLHKWGIEAQEQLKRTTVFAAGVGGSGSPLIMQLALAGFGTIIVCDYDQVELSNLNRQVLHDESRINMNKAISASQSVKQINPNVKVIAYTQKITRENILQMVGDAEIIFDNVDDMEAKFILSQCAVEKGIPHIISSMIDMNAYAAVFHTPYTPCFHCLYDRGVLKEMAELKSLVKDYRKNPNPVVSPPLFLSTGFAVNEAIKIVLGLDSEKSAYNKYFLFNQRGTENIVDSDGYRQITYPFSRHFREISRQQGFDWDEGWCGRFLDEIEITPDPQCPACGSSKRLEPLPGIECEEKIMPAVAEKTSGEATSLQTVVLLFNHGIDMIVGIMGTLKAGKIYVPLDPGYPVERLKYMLEDSDARLIVTDSENYEMAVRVRDRVNRHIGVVNVSEIIKNGEKSEENPGIDIPSDQLAYILYTSGSTGKPKGVMQSHRNVLHFARIYTNALHINADDRLTLFSSYGFDAAKMDIYGALLNGGTLYPYDIKQEGNLFQMARWLQSEDITIYHSIPTVYRYFTDMLTGEENVDSLRFIVLGGEAVFKKDVETYKKYFSDDCIFINGLGPTESTVTLQYFIDKNTEIKREAVPVGYAVEETEILLLDEEGNETEGYGIGEIIYKSDYLALGYLNKREKSDEVFVKNPLTGRDRVYRSGDLGRRLMDGSMEYVGRKDFQVKVRGYRIELGEIEGKLDNMRGIKKSVVVCSQDPEGENCLTAYYMVSDEREVEIDENNLVNQLKASIPDYMVPGAFYRLEGFPLTATGKIDRKALLESTGSQIRSMKEYVPPSEGIESTLVNMWKELLKVEKVGIYDNFFVLGGNSLKAIMLTSKLHKELEVKLPLTEVFKTPTIRELAEYIERASEDKFVSIDAVEKKEYYVLSSAQKRIYILHQMDVQSLGYNMSTLMAMEGDLNKEKLEETFGKLIERHESLRTSFIMIDEEPVQKTHKEVEFKIEFYDLARTQIEAEEGKIIQNSKFKIQNSFVRPFDLTKAPLLRVGLIKLEEKKHILMVDMHHIISDAVSNRILVRDFLLLYRGDMLKPLKLQYRDYSEWQNSEKERERIKQQKSYWLKQFSGSMPEFDLPIDYPRPANRSFEGSTYTFRIGKERAGELKKLAVKEGATLQMVMLTIFNVLLFKISGQEDIIVGTTAAGRVHPDLEKVIGVFVNTLALRNFPTGEKTFHQFLKAVKENSLNAYQNQDYPFENLVKHVWVNRNPNRNPLFDVMFEIRDNEGETVEIPGVEESEVKIKPYEFENSLTKFDLDWLGVTTGEDISFSVSYCTKLFHKESIELMAEEFLVLIEDIINDDHLYCKIKDLEYSTPIEKELETVQTIEFDF